jgi:hypothetical protein
VVLAVDGDQRNVRVFPVGNRYAFLRALTLRIASEIENDLARVEWTRRPSDRAVAPGLVEELTQSTVALVAAENENVRSASGRAVKSLRAEEIEMRQIPGKRLPSSSPSRILSPASMKSGPRCLLPLNNAPSQLRPLCASGEPNVAGASPIKCLRRSRLPA